LVSLSATGWNYDIVVENTATGPDFRSFVTATMDSGTAKNGGTFYENGLAGGGVGGLPAAGTVITSAADPNTTFTLQPYTQNNALLLAAQNASGRTGTLTLSTPTYLDRLAIFGSSGNVGGGTSNQNDTVLITFADNFAPQTFTITQIAQDWFGGSPTALSTRGRLSQVQSGSFDNVGGDNPRLYQATIDLSAFADHPVASITFTHNTTGGNASGGYAAIMAISGQVVPEPSSAALLACAAGFLGLRRRWAVA
jgi:hypothetical protein